MPMQLDSAIFTAIHRFWGVNRFLDALGVFLANTLPYILVLGMGVFILVAAHSMRERLFLAAEMFLAFMLARGMLAPIISSLVDRVRPFQALGFEPAFVPVTIGAFPSGHMAGLFSAAFVMTAFDPRWGLAYMGLGLVVGVARIFVGVHWPSDILAGIAVGLFCGWFVHFMVRPARGDLAAQAAAGAPENGMQNAERPGEE